MVYFKKVVTLSFFIIFLMKMGLAQECDYSSEISGLEDEIKKSIQQRVEFFKQEKELKKLDFYNQVYSKLEDCSKYSASAKPVGNPCILLKNYADNGYLKCLCNNQSNKKLLDQEYQRLVDNNNQSIANLKKQQERLIEEESNLQNKKADLKKKQDDCTFKPLEIIFDSEAITTQKNSDNYTEEERTGKREKETIESEEQNRMERENIDEFYRKHRNDAASYRRELYNKAHLYLDEKDLKLYREMYPLEEKYVHGKGFYGFYDTSHQNQLRKYRSISSDNYPGRLRFLKNLNKIYETKWKEKQNRTNREIEEHNLEMQKIKDDMNNLSEEVQQQSYSGSMNATTSNSSSTKNKTEVTDEDVEAYIFILTAVAVIVAAPLAIKAKDYDWSVYTELSTLNYANSISSRSLGIGAYKYFNKHGFGLSLHQRELNGISIGANYAYKLSNKFSLSAGTVYHTNVESFSLPDKNIVTGKIGLHINFWHLNMHGAIEFKELNNLALGIPEMYSLGIGVNF